VLTGSVEVAVLTGSVDDVAAVTGSVVDVAVLTGSVVDVTVLTGSVVVTSVGVAIGSGVAVVVTLVVTESTGVEVVEAASSADVSVVVAVASSAVVVDVVAPPRTLSRLSAMAPLPQSPQVNIGRRAPSSVGRNCGRCRSSSRVSIRGRTGRNDPRQLQPFAGPVLVADGDRRTRADLARLLESAGYDVLQAGAGDEAIALAQEGEPCVAILEVPLEVLSGYEVCRSLKASRGAGVAVIFLSGTRTESYDRVAGLLVGADDYLTKPYAPDELLVRVRRLEVRTRPLASGVREKLTPREAEVLRLLDEISRRLAISSKTVSTHIEHVLRKLGVHSRAQAVALAFRDETVELVA
jgi:DNA-binding response OmpR family regulator